MSWVDDTYFVADNRIQVNPTANNAVLATTSVRGSLDQGRIVVAEGRVE